MAQNCIQQQQSKKTSVKHRVTK